MFPILLLIIFLILFLILKFAKNGTKSDKLCDLFPIKDKKHNMQTRDEDKFKVTFANTNRLKHSSIVTMQNMLNDDAKTARTS